MPKPKFLLDADSARLINKTGYHIRPGKFRRQGGGAATQLPAEQYHSGSNPDLGFNYSSESHRFLRYPKYVSTM
jgi:hypothetical protein